MLREKASSSSVPQENHSSSLMGLTLLLSSAGGSSIQDAGICIVDVVASSSLLSCGLSLGKVACRSTSVSFCCTAQEARKSSRNVSLLTGLGLLRESSDVLLCGSGSFGLGGH